MEKNNNVQPEINVIEQRWENATVYIVGGGPSLCGFDWELLRNKKVIALNRAFEVLPWADVLYWTDSRFYTWYKSDIDNFQGLCVTCEPVHKGSTKIIVLNAVRKSGIDLRPGYICRARNSAAGGINLAVKLGAKRIYLLGVDLKELPDQSHWHDGYSKFNVRTYPTGYQVMQEDFFILQKPLTEMGIEVWNANPNSSLRGYPKCSLESALNESPERITYG